MTTLYRLLTGPDDSSFCHKVSKALADGWSLHGSPAISFDAAKNTMICAQAVTREIDGKYQPDKPLGQQ